MAKTRIAHNAWIVVADGGRALILRNDGADGADMRLNIVRAYGQNNPPTREQGSDKPGRAHSSVGTHRSAMEPTDFHQQAEDRLMAEVAAQLADDFRRQAFSELVIAAAPESLGVLRKLLNSEVKKVVVAELPKNFAHHYLPDLQDALGKALKAA